MAQKARAARPIVLALLLACGAASSPSDAPPPLFEGARWLDDWFAVASLDARTFAIFEPRYAQYNLSYLILGDERALLLDTGPGERAIRPVVERLTSLPVTAAFSHTHFDHIGGHVQFDSVAALDHPSLRERIDGQGLYTPTLGQHGGFGRPSFRIREWWAPDQELRLGGRTLRVLPVPGHTPESLALFDAENGQLFTGDFLYPGDLYAFVPGSDLHAYRESTRRLLELSAGLPELAIYGAHIDRTDRAPRQGRDALLRLERALGEILDEAHEGRPSLEMGIPVRRHDFGGLTILTPLW